MSETESIKLALVGAGGCAQAFAKGLIRHTHDERYLIHPQIGPYSPRSVFIAVLFDVDAEKVGLTLGDLLGEISSAENMPAFLDAPIMRGPTLDGLSTTMQAILKVSSDPQVSVSFELQALDVDIVVNLLPTAAN